MLYYIINNTINKFDIFFLKNSKKHLMIFTVTISILFFLMKIYANKLFSLKKINFNIYIKFGIFYQKYHKYLFLYLKSLLKIFLIKQNIENFKKHKKLIFLNMFKN